jgi:single-strand DNA-binding protein
MAGRSLNKVILIGNLATDPTIKYTPNGSMVCTFVVATNRRYTKADGSIAEEAEFTPIAAWGKLAEVCQKILAKGMLTYVEGRLKTHSWDAQDGSKRYKTEIRALDIILLDSKDKTPLGMPAEMGSGAPASAPVPAAASHVSAGSGVSADEAPVADKAAAKPAASDADISDEELDEILSDSTSSKKKTDKETK